MGLTLQGPRYLSSWPEFALVWLSHTCFGKKWGSQQWELGGEFVWCDLLLAPMPLGPGVLLPPYFCLLFPPEQKTKQKNWPYLFSHTNHIFRNNSRSCYWKTNDRTEIPNGQGKWVINVIMDRLPKVTHFAHFLPLPNLECGREEGKEVCWGGL